MPLDPDPPIMTRRELEDEVERLEKENRKLEHEIVELENRLNENSPRRTVCEYYRYRGDERCPDGFRKALRKNSEGKEFLVIVAPSDWKFLLDDDQGTLFCREVEVKETT